MERTLESGKKVTLEVEVIEELARGVEKMAKLMNLSTASLIQSWIEEGLEREELRFERLLLFADMVKDLDEETIHILSELKAKYFDSVSDGKRGLDPYMVKSLNLNHLYYAKRSLEESGVAINS